jgi:hypothetical protein
MITASLQERSQAIAYPGLFATPTAIPPFKRVIVYFEGSLSTAPLRYQADRLFVPEGPGLGVSVK